MATWKSVVAIFDVPRVNGELYRLYDQAKLRGLPEANCRAFASAMLTEQLAVIVRQWQDDKANEAEQTCPICGNQIGCRC